MSDIPMPVPPRLLPSLPPAVTSPGSDGTVKRPRGRPPGSRNRRPEAELHPPQTLGSGSGRGRPTPPNPPIPSTPDEAAISKLKQEKQERADQYAVLIHKELNDQLFTAIIGMRLVPAEVIYKSGHVPPASQPDPTLTEIGNMIAIPTDLAKNVGKLLAELSFTPAGKSVVGLTQNNMAGVAMAALAAFYSTYRYTQQLKPFLDMVRASQAAATVPPEEQGEETSG